MLILLTVHRRNCKANPRCVNALGEGKWFQEIKDNYWYDAEDADAERRESVRGILRWFFCCHKPTGMLGDLHARHCHILSY